MKGSWPHADLLHVTTAELSRQLLYEPSDGVQPVALLQPGESLATPCKCGHVPLPETATQMPLLRG